MGNGSYDANTYRSYSQTNRLTDHTTRRDQIFTQQALARVHDSLDPRNIRVRESRDSAGNPTSNALAFFVDVTGSMGMIAEQMVREGLNTLLGQLYERQPLTNPQLMFGGIGDLKSDRVPLQLSQFESDIRILEQLRLLYLEGNGGGNNGESYSLPWYFLSRHSSIDCFEKRNKKGYLFTMGDEPCHQDMPREKLGQILSYFPETNIQASDALQAAQEKYEVFHLIIAQGDYCQRTDGRRRCVDSWRDLLGDRAILLPDYTKMPQVITSIIQATEGVNRDTILSSWDEDTRRVVEQTITGIGAYGRRVEL